MPLAELLESQFRGDIRFRGVAYVEAERVSLTRITADNVYGAVRDGDEYHTQLTRDDGKLRMYCTCDRYQKSGVCKHLWGTILAVDAAGLTDDSIRPGHIPPFAAEPEPFSFDDDDLDDFVMEPGRRSAAAGRTPRPSGGRVQVVEERPWATRLEQLRGEFDQQAAAKEEREREIFYEIDVEESLNAKQLVIQTSQRQRRADGQWGKLKPLKLRHGKQEQIELVIDRRILAYLSGALPERSNWYAQQAGVQASAFRYQIPYELCELILPLISETKRLRYLNSSEKAWTPLEWDEGPAWELNMQVLASDDRTSWSLNGYLLREEQKMRIPDATLIVPGGLVFTKNGIAKLHDFGAYEWVMLLQEEDVLEVDEGEQVELVDKLLDMPALPRLDLPAELRLEEVECDPQPQLLLRSPGGPQWKRDRLRGQVRFDYMGNRVSASSAQWAIVQREHNRCILRNKDAEAGLQEQLLDAGFRRLADTRGNQGDVEIMARELGRGVRSLIEQGWKVHADEKQVRQAHDIQFKVESGIDWFELDAKVDFEGHSVAFPELLAALTRGDSTVRLDDGSLGILPEQWLQQFGMLTGLGVVNDERLRFSNNQVALLDALLSSQDEVDYDDRFLELRERFRNFEGIEEASEPEAFKGELRTYQKEGLGWLGFLQDFHFGGCLADDMGLGKTVQLIALILARRTENKGLPPSLIVVPKSLLFNWFQECERFAPQLRVLEYTGLDRASLRDEFSRTDMILTTYGTLRRDISSLRDTPFDYIVLDEAQTIKNASSQIAKASRLLQAQHRVALSGTPIENHLGDLWSIFEFLNPGMLGRSSAFRSFAADSDDQGARQMLAAGLRPFILRRTKEQVASELPEKFEETIYCEMGEEQRAKYDEMRVHYRQRLLGMVADQGMAKSRMHVLEALLRLRQAACHPALLAKEDEEARAASSAKLDVLLPQIQELISEGHKALVFSQFTSMLSIVREKLDAAGIVYEYLDGKTRNRQQPVTRFQEDPECGLFLISLKAGGLGLNLTAADYVFLLDPWWNPAVEAQAIDRAHRVGQTRKVFAYRLICRDTVEEKIAELQGQKKKLADAILNADNAANLKDLSAEDLEMLLS